MIQSFGDLKGYANYRDVLEYEPRDMFFKTDSLGFRNNSDYTNQSFALVGDSFIAGTGVTQKHTLSSILRDEYQADTYSMAVAGAGIPEAQDFPPLLCAGDVSSEPQSYETSSYSDGEASR